MDQKIKETQLSFTKLSFFENYVISEIKEGCYLTRELFEYILVELDAYYGSSKKYVYISLRKSDFNVNPVDYLNCTSNDNLIALAIVTETDSKKKTAEFEKKFITKNVGIFNTLKEAIHWAEDLVQN